MAELFDVNVPAISKHLSNIYADGELKRKATGSKMETVQKEGNRQIKRERESYKLDTIIADRSCNNRFLWTFYLLFESRLY